MSKGRRGKTVWLDRGWYPPFIGFVPSKKAWDRVHKDLNLDDFPYPDDHPRCTTIRGAEEDAKTCILITIPERLDVKEKGGLAAVIAHEAVHAWQSICQDISETEPGAEQEAYAVQFIMLGVMNALEETRGVKF